MGIYNELPLPKTLIVADTNKLAQFGRLFKLLVPAIPWNPPKSPLNAVLRYISTALDHACGSSLDCMYRVADGKIATPPVGSVEDFIYGRGAGIRAFRGYGAIDAVYDIGRSGATAVLKVGGYTIATAYADGRNAVAVFKSQPHPTPMLSIGTRIDLPNLSFFSVDVDRRIYDLVQPTCRSSYIMASAKGGWIYVCGVPALRAATLFSYNLPAYPLDWNTISSAAAPSDVLPLYVYLSRRLLSAALRHCYRIEKSDGCVKLVRACPRYDDLVRPNSYHPYAPINVYNAVAELVGFMPTAVSSECVPGGVQVVDQYGFIYEYEPKPVRARSAEEPPHPALNDLFTALGAQPPASYMPIACAIGKVQCKVRPSLEDAARAVCLSALGPRCNDVAQALIIAVLFNMVPVISKYPLEIPASWMPIAVQMSQMTGRHYSHFLKPWPMYCVKGDAASPVPYETAQRYIMSDIVETAYNIKLNGLCDAVAYIAMGMDREGRPNVHVEVAE
jgi:hypothetical protein